MLISVITHALIPLSIFICFSRHKVKAENEFDHSFESSTTLATSEIEENEMDQNLNWNCARLAAVQDAEKIFNKTDDSAEANVNRKEYHSRIKRCTDKKRQEMIIRKFGIANRMQKQEMKEVKLKETHHKNYIRKTTLHESATQKYDDQNTNKDSTLMDDLYQTMSHLENTESYSRTYRTVAVNSTSFANDISSTSISQNSESASTEPSSFTNSVEKLSKIFEEDQPNVVSSSQKTSLSRESEISETLYPSTVPYTIIPRIKSKPKRNNPRSRSTKIIKNNGTRKQGLLRSLLGRVEEVMQGGTLKNSVDLDNSDLNEKSSSTDPNGDGFEYEPVTPHKFFDHFTKSSNKIYSSVRSHDEQENPIIQKIREDTKKELQSKTEELEELREKWAEILRNLQLTKNRTKTWSPAFNKTSAKYETEIAYENLENNKNFHFNSDKATTQSIENYEKSTQNFIQKTTTSEMPSNDLQKQNFPEKHTTLGSSAITQSSEIQEKTAPEHQVNLKNSPPERTGIYNLHATVLSSSEVYSSKHNHTNHEQPSKTRIDFHNLHTTVLTSSEIDSSKHYHTSHEKPLKTYLQNEDLSRNQNQKDSPSHARSENDENSNQRLFITQKASPPTFNLASAKHETKITNENFKNNENFYHNLDKITTQSNEKITQNAIQKATASEMPSKDPQKQHFSEKDTTFSSSAITLSPEKQDKSASKHNHTNHEQPLKTTIDFRNLHTPIIPSLEMHSSKHPHTSHENPLKTHPQNEDLLKNQNQKDFLSQARSENDENRQKASSTGSIKQFDSTSSTINLLHTQTERTQKPSYELGLSSENKPKEIFQTSSTKVPSLSSTLRHEMFSEEPAMVEYLHQGKRSTPQTSKPKSPITQPITLSKERTISSEHPLHDTSATIHFHRNHEEDPKSALVSSERVELKTETIFQHGKPSEESAASLNHHITKISSPEPLNGDNASSGLVGKSHPSVADQLHHVHHPKTISKSTTQLLLEKITQLTPFYKVEEWKKIITPGKQYLDGISTHQPIQSHKDVSPKNIATEKSHVSRTILPLVHDHSHQTHLSEISATQRPHSPLKVKIPRKSSPLILNIKHSSENFPPHSHRSIEVTLPIKSHAGNHLVHQSNNQHDSAHSTEIPSKKITIEKAWEESSSTPHLDHSQKFRHFDENITPHSHHSFEVTSSMKPQTENHLIHQPNHHHPSHSTEIPSKNIVLGKAEEERSSSSHMDHSQKFKNLHENFTPHPHYSIEVTLPTKTDTENHIIHQPNHHHPSHSTEIPSKKITFRKTQEESSSTSLLDHSPKLKNSDENFNPHHSIEVTLQTKSHIENHVVHKPNHRRPFHSARMPLKIIPLKKVLEESRSTSHGAHSPKFRTLKENVTSNPTHSIGVTLPMKSHTENHLVHQPNHHHPSHSIEIPSKKITLGKALEESSSTSHLDHSPKLKNLDENLTPHLHHLIEVTLPTKSHTENHQVHQPDHHHPSHSTEFPLKKITLDKVQKESSSTSHLDHSPKFKIADENFIPRSHHSVEMNLPTKYHTENHLIHQPNHYHPFSATQMPLKIITLKKVLEGSSSPAHGIHSLKFKMSGESVTQDPTHSIGVTLPMKSHTENHPVHQPNHHHPSHVTEIPLKKITLEKAQEKSSSTSHSDHSPKLKNSDENFTPHHSIEVTLQTKSHIENHLVHQPNHHHPFHSAQGLLKITPLKKVLEESSSTSRGAHSSKFKTSEENATPNPTHSIGVTLPMKSHTENPPVHQPNLHHPSHSIGIPSKKIALNKAWEESSSTSHMDYSPKLKTWDENFTPHHSIEVTLPTESHTENHLVHQSNHHHPSLKIITVKKAPEESSSTSHGIHSSKFRTLEENVTPHPTHSIGVTLPMKSHTENHPVHHPNPRDHEAPKFDKTSTLQPSVSTDSFLKKITSFEKAEDKSSPSFYSVHSHSKSKLMHEISTPHPSHRVKLHMNGLTSPKKSDSESQTVPQTVHHQHQESPHVEKTSTLLPSYSTKIHPKEKYSQNSHEIFHVTPLPHSSTTQLKNIDTPSNLFEEIKILEMEKMEEIKHLQQKELELLRKNYLHRPSHKTLSGFEAISDQKTSKSLPINSTPSYKETHSTKNTAQGRSNSEENINTLHTHCMTKPYPTHFTNPTILPNDEMVDMMPLPPLNPNDNWIYLKKLDEWYERQKAKKSSTQKPPIIHPLSAVPTPRPRTISSSTIAPTTAPLKIRPTTPSRNKTTPNQRPNSATQKPPSPVNYHIDSNRSYNITINMVTPDFTPREDDEERNEDEPVNNPSSNLLNEAGFGNDPDMVRSARPPQVTNEPSGDFDSLPHPSLPRGLPFHSTHLSDSPSMDQTTPLPSSFMTPTSSKESVSLLQTKTSSRDDSSLTPHPSENETILQSSIRSDSKQPKHLPTISTLRQKMLDKLKNSTSKVLADSSITPASTPLTTDVKTVPTVLPHPLPSVGNCTLGCNNYIIIIPNKTEEIIQILHKNDQKPLIDQSATLQAPRLAQNGHISDPNSSSDIKSLLDPIIKAKMTPSNNTELRKSINELMTSLKQRRFNEYTKLYQYRLNPMVGDGQNSIVAITQLNEYIELLELMLVYLARDPDKLLDEKKDARIDNFESPYTKDDPQRRLIEDQFHYVHPKILNEFIDVYKKYSKGERYYGRPAWQFSEENDPRGRSSRPRTSGGLLSNLFNFQGLLQPLIYNRAPMDRQDTRYYDD